MLHAGGWPRLHKRKRSRTLLLMLMQWMKLPSLIQGAQSKYSSLWGICMTGAGRVVWVQNIGKQAGWMVHWEGQLGGALWMEVNGTGTASMSAKEGMSIGVSESPRTGTGASTSTGVRPSVTGGVRAGLSTFASSRVGISSSKCMRASHSAVMGTSTRVCTPVSVHLRWTEGCRCRWVKVLFDGARLPHVIQHLLK